MLTTLDIPISGREYAQRLLEDITECCDRNINLISCNDHYALRLFVRELSIDRIENGDEHVLYYFVFSREIDGDYKKLHKGKNELLEELIEYRRKRKNRTFEILDHFIQAIGGF